MSLDVTPGTGESIKTTIDGTDHVPHHIVDAMPEVVVDDSTPVDVNITTASVTVDGTVIVDDSTPVDVNITNASIAVTGGALPSTVVYGVQAVTTAGTEVQLGSNTITRSVTVRAHLTNTGTIYLGGNSSVSSTTGYRLSPGQSVTLEVANTNSIWVDSSVNGEGISFIGS